ncbi:MAG: OmpA family protein [Bacteroidia bacterium]|nr:OmpA family protein [Bacteroidia bacterium]
MFRKLLFPVAFLLFFSITVVSQDVINESNREIYKEALKLVENKVYLFLGNLYHLDYKFDKAINNYDIFIRKEGRMAPEYKYAQRMIEICNNAKQYVPDSVEFKILNLGRPINTIHSEYSPMVSTDESILYFTRKKNPDIPDAGFINDTLEHIYVTYYKSMEWTEPNEILSDFSAKSSISLAGLSPDGEQLFVNIGGDIFICKVSEGKYTQPVTIGQPINSEYKEGNANITADGNILYFSSNSPGGFGGMDIYKSELGEDRKWSKPENLGPAINTIYDEDAPFIHPDKKSLFFSSKGHATIGCFDIFQSYLTDDSWTQPLNMGYPVNTVKDDMHIILSAEGKKGYFSSDKQNKYYCHDIYKIDLRKSIKLTMLKGKITAGEPAKPIKATIKVIDKETGLRVKYVYDPNPMTGRYLLIFPPGKNYDMIFEAEGFLPHLVNVYVPEQEKFYELYQEIHLDAVSAKNEKIGEKITVTNTFQDLSMLVSNPYETTPNPKYNELIKMIDDIVSATDSIVEAEPENTNFDFIADTTKFNLDTKSDRDFSALFKMVDEVINVTEMPLLAQFDENSGTAEKISQIYFYSKDKEYNNLQPVIVGNDTIYTTPAITVSSPDPFDGYKPGEISEKDTVTIDFGKIKENYKKVIFSYDVEFLSKKTIVREKYKKELIDLAALAREDNKLGFNIIGFCDNGEETKGDNSACISLGNDRVEAVRQVLMKMGVPPERIVSQKWNGVPNSKKEKNYCAQLRFFEIVDKPLFNLTTFEIIDFDEEELEVEDIELGQEVRLNNIFFEYASAALTPESTTELLNVVKFLNNNPRIRIEIAGHTDNIGQPEHNIILSKARAQAVFDFLINKNIDGKRLIVNGYGDTKSIADNNFDAGRALNRRVVFMILEK